MHGRPRCETSQRTLRARHDRHALGARLRTLLGFLGRTPAALAAAASMSVAIVCREVVAACGSVGVVTVTATTMPCKLVQ